MELEVKIIEDTNREDHRPWGFYRVLEDEPADKVKRIHVYPGKRLSLQRHKRREEHWFVIGGEGIVTLENEKIPCRPGDSISIPKGSIHRAESTGKSDFIFIEVQTGDYFGEDDIERLEDDFGRT